MHHGIPARQRPADMAEAAPEANRGTLLLHLEGGLFSQ